MASYRALVGLDYEGKRVEPGQTVDDLPAKSISWLVKQGLVEQASAAAKSVKTESTKREPESPKKEA
jgi:hypothetical protein